MPAPCFLRLLPATLCLLAGLWLPARSGAQVGLKIQLVPEVTSIAPGVPFRVGLFIQHDPGHHTYWRQPGIVGVPTTMTWTLPEGFTAGPLEYPEPETTRMFRIKAQGYDRDVLLQTEIRPPAGLVPGEKVRLTGKAAWMCCGKTCHPGALDLGLELPVQVHPRPAGQVFHPQWHPLFEKERAAYAHASPAWTAAAEELGQEVTLRLKPSPAGSSLPSVRPFADAAEAQKVIFFTEDGFINSDEPQTAALEPDGTLVLTLRRADAFLGKSPPERLNGILQRPGGWLADGGLRSLIVSPVLRR